MTRAWCTALPGGVRLADALSVPRGAVTITHGHTSKRKLVEVQSDKLTVDAVTNALLPLE